MGVLIFVALLFAIPTNGLSLLPVLGAVTLRAWVQGAATKVMREQQIEPALPARQVPAPRASAIHTLAAPTWVKDWAAVERFRSDLYEALPRRGVPRSYVATALANNEVISLALASARTAEENGKDFYRQCFASADVIVRRWNGLPLPEQNRFLSQRP
ncbi:hypothetical protein [Sphingomonas sp. 3-13AW]|jgi:hypothetical protein|uniref:hypothetical protein n=1 Tax=Sphingomonas sp. 3-13AW TaxID=3050450 RepID=UPI003BB5908C